jgi:hypothetical protein
MWPRDRGDPSTWSRATWTLLYYVVIPTALITAIMWRYPELDRTHFMEMLRWVMIVGVALVGVNALRADAKYGTFTRLALDAAFVALTIGWLLGILGGGTALEQSWNGYHFIVDITGIFIIVAALASLNLVYYFLRFAQERGYITKGGDEPLPDPVVEPGAVTIEYVDEGTAQ